MAAEQDIIVAVELSSTSIRAIAGTKQADGTMQVVAFAQEKGLNTIRKGVIDNIDKTTQAISQCVHKLADQLSVRITRIYVGLAGQSMHSVRNVVPQLLGEKSKITEDIIDRMKDVNQSVDYPDRSILEVVPQEYRIGNRAVSDPVGMQSESVEAVFLNVVARKELYENIEVCVRNAGLELVDILISPICLAESQLSSSERRSGCALVDIGAETTTVSVYKNDIMRHLVVIPLGGANVTADISSMGMEMDEAEDLKLKHGTAYYKEAENESTRPVQVSFGREVKESDLKYYSSARYEEIICNIGEQLKDRDDLICGIVLTGGAAHVQNIQEAFAEYIKWTGKVQLRKGLPQNVELAHGLTVENINLLHTLIALLQKGEQNCVAPKVEEPEVVAAEEPEIQQTEELQQTEESEAETVEETKEPRGKNIKTAGKSLWQKLTEMLTEE